MSELTPHQQKALTTEGHLALTANAGSGKTFVLARKYLSVLLKENIDVTNVAAITFTEKAASELYYKISLLIDERINSSIILNEKKKLEKIRRQLVSANISTIHSFCIDILKQYPVEAQLDARFIPIDENLSNELIEISVEEMIRSAFDNELVREDLKYLIRIFSSKSKLESEIVELIKNRKNVLAVIENIYSKDEDKIQQYFSNMFSEYFLLIWERNKEALLKSLESINTTVLETEHHNQFALDVKNYLTKLKTEKEIPDILSLLNKIKPLAFTDKIKIRKKGYLKSDLSESLSDDIAIAENQMSELIKFEITDDQKKIEKELAKFGLVVLKFFDQALMIYESKKKAEGFIDFEDILLHTKILLQNDDVQKSLSEKYKFIMVDEFQDTNEIQYQIFLPILDYLKNGKLFIVGDEKQSIYKFRDAEIQIFNLTRDNIKAEAGDNSLLSLPDSFRMTPAICAFTNFIFKKLFTTSDELYGEVPNTDLVCARNDNLKGKIEFLFSKVSKGKDVIEESEIVSQKILEIIKENRYHYKDICILVRKRKNFDELEKSFLNYNIPYTIVGGRGFYQRQTISDVYNYLSFLADENNSSALVGVLRSPFFSVSDTKLFEISLQKGNSFWRKLKAYAREKNEFQNYVSILQENIKICSSVDLPQLIRKLITDKNFLSVVSSRIDGTQELANLEKLISISRNFNSKGFRNLYDFIIYLKESITGLEDEAQAAFTEDKDAVQMMTIHQAKGLEFPIVFIYKSAEASLSGSLKAGRIQVDKKFGLLAKLPLNENYFDEYSSAPVNSVFNYLEAKKNMAELKRLLYVAITRAKDELYISASVDEEKSFNRNSFISLLSIGLNNLFLSDNIFIQDKLNYLIKNNGEYQTKTELLELAIRVRTNIEVELPERSEINHFTKKFNFELEKLESREKGEIISASKVSIYNQCPLKYILTYEYGFAKLNSEAASYKKNLNNYNKLNLPEIDTEADDNIDLSSEQETQIKFNPADYGKLFHKILEQEISSENLEMLLNQITGTDSVKSNKFNLDKEKFKKDLTDYYVSKTYQQIKSYKNFKNEFEIYVKDDDYFLHGIIDKIIFDGKKIIIFDYKTDDLELKEVKKHAEYYLMQLKFYLYIASKLFEGFDTFEGNLVFIKHPDNPVSVLYDKNGIKNLRSEVKTIINSLRNKEISKNYAHCKLCAFSDFTNKCIVKEGVI